MGLQPEKQQTILKAAFAEFAEHGYKNASTNRIVEAAGIGKGMLFYYFNSKQELFEFLADYGMTFISEHYLPQLSGDGGAGFIETLQKASRIKMEAYLKYPHLFNFFSALMSESNIKHLPDQLRRRVEDLQSLGTRRLVSNVDMSMFREDIPPEAAMQYAQWLIDGYLKKITDTFSGTNYAQDAVLAMWDDYDVFLEHVKAMLYVKKKG
ncbi:MAG: TetR/AcrR family transcriptional regulator [Oscillospiraceae bacterium]|nr:TetR/AcrR family transcriptional regulator [Oscillospiraceae bacterium]